MPHLKNTRLRVIGSRAVWLLALLALSLVSLAPAVRAAAGTITEFALPTATSQPQFITRGPDNALWFTEVTGNKIGRISTTGTITEFALPTATSQPVGIVQGPDKRLWFTELESNKIGRISTQ